MHLSPGGQQFRGDDGSADPAVAEALDRFGQGEGSEHAALTALAASRLLVPVVALLTEAGADGAEKNSEMALPTLIGQDGRPAIIAFTSVASLTRWRADARPMPAEADRVWRSAVAEQAAVVVDVAGPVPFVIEGARLNALATGQPPPRPDEDPDVHAAIEAVIAAEPVVQGARLGPPVSAGADLHVQLLLAPGGEAALAPGGEAAVQSAAEQISVALAHRLRRGIEFSAAIVADT
jgi:SseB protein N-terminal domain